MSAIVAIGFAAAFLGSVIVILLEIGRAES
jgi:hypothetical protein